MISHILFAAALCGTLALPLAAQEVETAPAQTEPRGKPRFFAPALPDYRGKEEPRPDKSWASWVTNADYPLAAWRNREEGVVQYDVAVDAHGKPTGCTITYSTATPALEAETCRLLMERARFEPAEDKGGTPRASVWPGETKWHVREPDFSKAFMLKVAFTIDERGQQRDCRIVERSNELPPNVERSLRREACPSNYAARGVPYRDADGRPVAREVTMTYGISLAPLPAED